MQSTRLSHSTRLTALGLALTLVGVTFSPLALAQQAPAPATPDKAPATPDKAPAPAPTPKAAPAPAAKAPDKKTRDSARKAYSEGEKAFSVGDFTAAEAAFQTANSLIPSPHAEYWIAKSLDGQPEKLNEAIAAYEQFLANPDAAKAGEEKVADAQTRVAALKAKLPGDVEVVTVPPGATVSVDSSLQLGTTPLVLKLPPGPHKLSVTLAGFESKELELDVKGGEPTHQKIELAAVPPPPAPAPPPAAVAEPVPVEAPPAPAQAQPRSKIPAFVTLGIAAAGAVVGTVFGLKALSAKNDFEDNPTTERADDTERNALIADMAFGVAITLGVTGVVLLTTSDDVPETASVDRLRLRPLQASRLPKAVPMKLELDTYGNRTGGGGNLRLTF